MADNFKVRLAVDRNECDGHLKNIMHIGTDELASVDYISARFSTLWTVTEEIDNYAIVSYIDSQSTGFSSQLYACSADYASDLSNFFLVFAARCRFPPARIRWRARRRRARTTSTTLINTIKTPKTDVTEKRPINTLTWNIDEDITLKNILAYAHLHTENGSDSFGTQFCYNAPLRSLPVIEIPELVSIGDPIPLDPNPAREFKTGVSVVNPDILVTSQETYVAGLQLQGQSFEGALEWQGGLYYEDSRPDVSLATIRRNWSPGTRPRSKGAHRDPITSTRSQVRSVACWSNTPRPYTSTVWRTPGRPGSSARSSACGRFRPCGNVARRSCNVCAGIGRGDRI